VISIDRADVSLCFAGLAEPSDPIVNTIKEYDLIVSWLENKEGEFSRHLGRIGAKKIVASRPISQRTTHEHRVKIFLEALSPLGIPSPFLPPQVFPSPEDRRLGQDALRRQGIKELVHGFAVRGSGCGGIGRPFSLFPHGPPHIKPRPLLAIHPGSGGCSKCWDFTRFIEVSRLAKEQLGLQPLFILGPVERGLSVKLKNSLGNDVAILDCLPLPILAGALTWCSAFLGNDSGATHLAAALDIPAAAIFGPTDPHLWGPIGRHVRVLSKRAENRHAGQERCHGCDCLDRVSVEDVIQTLAEIVLDYSPTIC
jgi:ADP-heptose:LPS heptosyltransferase